MLVWKSFQEQLLQEDCLVWHAQCGEDPLTKGNPLKWSTCRGLPVIIASIKMKKSKLTVILFFFIWNPCGNQL